MISWDCGYIARKQTIGWGGLSGMIEEVDDDDGERCSGKGDWGRWGG